jgi:hypothetical protein
VLLEVIQSMATVGIISLFCVLDKVYRATESTQKPQRGTEALALKANNRLDIVQIPLLVSLLAVGIDHLQEHATLPDKTLGYNLHHARRVCNAGTSSYKYFVLQALVQEATESETA